MRKFDLRFGFVVEFVMVYSYYDYSDVDVKRDKVESVSYRCQPGCVSRFEGVIGVHETAQFFYSE